MVPRSSSSIRGAIVRRLYPLFLLLVIGCGDWTVPVDQSKPTPKPTPTVHDAGDQAKLYLSELADAFDVAASGYESHQQSKAINETFGDQQRDARLKAFTPLMLELNATRPASDVSDSEREEYDAKSSALLRKWASQIRGGK